MSQPFFERLDARSIQIDSQLCVGLDPRVPDGLEAAALTSWLVNQNKKLIEATADLTLVYKPNIAFYEAHGEAGLLALRTTLGLIPAEIPVILDAKRGDIGATSEAYASAAFDQWQVDAITVAPYMGSDSVQPFGQDPTKGVFVLCKTSNPGSAELQTLELTDQSGQVLPLYEHVARLATAWGPNYGLVVAANDTAALRHIRSRFPKVWFLAPGIGAQGGSIAEAVAAGANAEGRGILLNVSRSLADAPDPRAAIQALVAEYRQARDQALKRSAAAGARTPADDLKTEFLRGLIKTGCFKTGEFTLKSGQKSPFYVDLRRVMSDPGLLRLAGQAYASLIGHSSPFAKIKFHRLAGIPVAALPLSAATSLATNLPMIFPRLQQKEHGTGNTVEGAYEAGETVLLLDDLITTGQSKIEAIRILRAAGLKVNHLIVLLERGVQGRRDMEAEGVELLAFAHIGEFLPICEELGLIDASQRTSMEAYASGTGA